MFYFRLFVISYLLFIVSVDTHIKGTGFRTRSFLYVQHSTTSLNVSHNNSSLDPCVGFLFELILSNSEYFPVWPSLTSKFYGQLSLGFHLGQHKRLDLVSSRK